MLEPSWSLTTHDWKGFSQMNTCRTRARHRICDFILLAEALCGGEMFGVWLELCYLKI